MAKLDSSSNNSAFGFLDEHQFSMPACKPLWFLWIRLVSALIVGDRALKRNGSFGNACWASQYFAFFNYLVLLVLVPLLVFKLVEILVGRRMSAIAIIKKVSGWNMIQIL